MATLRRRGIHPPQLVGRVSPPRPGEDPTITVKRMIGELDSAMQELQRFLKYQQDANDSGQVGSGIEGVVDGSVEQYLKEKLYGGLASEVPLHDHSSTDAGGQVSHATLTMLEGGGGGHYFHLTQGAAAIAENPILSRGGTVLAPAGAIDIIVWRAPFACTVTAVKGYRSGGTGATINARRNGTSDHLASDLSLTSADTWMDGGAVQNTAYVTGDKLEIRLVTLAGSPTKVAVQIDFVRI